MAGAGKRGIDRGRGNARPQSLLPNAFDGPNDPRGRTDSQSQQSLSRSGSQTRAVSVTRGQAQTGTGPRGDPAREPAPRILSRNVEFGGNAYNLLDGHLHTSLMPREGFGKAGKPVNVNINSHVVKAFPTKNVYQYDILIGSGGEKRGLLKAIAASKTFKDKTGPGFIFDGNRIGWSMNNLSPNLRFIVDLDQEKGIQPKKDRENKHRVQINHASGGKNKDGVINIGALEGYLAGQMSFDNSVLEAINFLDHLLRETPSKQLINLRRSYFARATNVHDRTLLTGGVEAMKGVYQSLRAAEGKKLIINVDVSNSCFWQETRFDNLAYMLSGINDQKVFMANITVIRPGQTEPAAYRQLRRLHKNQFHVKHRGGADSDKLWTVQRISHLNAKTYKFDLVEKATGITHKDTSVYDYFVKRYNVRLEKWNFPLLETTKKGVVFPMELAFMASGQKYPYKLNELQTSNMIKFAVSRPPVRKAAIDQGLSMLKWQQDDYLVKYGLRIDPQMLTTKARVLDPPEVLFAKNATAKPMFSGRWDLRGKVFFKPNEQVLKSWGVCVLQAGQGDRGGANKDQIMAFIDNFIKLYKGHGGRIENSKPPITGGIPDTSKALEAAFQAAGNAAQLRPQMLLVVVPNRSAEIYNRVKKNCDCRWGVMSQCVQAANVVKNAPQYCSNVLMKFNCKLGGTTSALKSKKAVIKVPTMILGADVSHGAPGSCQASMAAITMSLDTTCSRYAATVQSNGYRVEMIATSTFEESLKPLIQHWMQNVGKGMLPQHVYYFRDGVSEGQYTRLLKEEVADIKRVMASFKNRSIDAEPKFTVVVCEKRHHIRFFPPSGPAADKNMNPVPGVVVDHDVTHPFENDVYLCSHAAIQGTARPTHYHMLIDEMKVPVDDFQALLYEHCYQYQRATTPVSLFPATYYAHLASNRAVSHINEPLTQTWFEKKQLLNRPGVPIDNAEKTSESECPPLLPFEMKNGIDKGMWYI